eukprot:2269665-Rhodomonas_salina.1
MMCVVSGRRLRTQRGRGGGRGREGGQGSFQTGLMHPLMHPTYTHPGLMYPTYTLDHADPSFCSQNP